MALSLELIQILDAIDRNGSFEAAAQELHKVRSALTYNIRKYEEQMKIKIFDRSQHKAQFTNTGRAMLEQGRELLTLHHKVEENLRRIDAGYECSLRIAYDEIIDPDTILPFIRQLKDHFPQLSIELFSEILGGCARALAEKSVDVAIGLTGRLPNSSTIEYKKLGTVRFVFAVSPKHPLAKAKEPISEQELNQWPWIFARDSADRYSKQVFAITSHETHITFSSMELKIKAQLMGIGIGFLPKNLIQSYLNNNLLVIKKVVKPKPDSMLYVGWHQNKNNLAQKFLIEQVLNSNLMRFHR